MICRPSLRAALVLCFASLAAASAQAQTTPIARLECTAQNYPSCGGWSAMPTNQYHTRRLVAGVSPTGGDAVQFDLVSVDHHNQFYMGWQRMGLPSVPQGSRRYMRIRFRILTPFNAAGVGDVWTTKFVIVGDPDDSRMIIDLKPVTSNTSLSVMAQKGVGGGPTVPLVMGAWNSVQVELRSSSSTGAGDAQLSTWVNEQNSQFSNPNVRSALMTLNTGAWTNVNVGYYSNATISSSGRVSIQIAEAEWDDQFDPNWHTGGGTTPPPVPAPEAPTNVRVIRVTGAAMALPFVGWLFARRRRREDDSVAE